MRDRVQFGLMLAPYLTGLVALVIVPAIAGFGLAFADYNALQPPRFAGLANFRELLERRRLPHRRSPTRCSTSPLPCRCAS